MTASLLYMIASLPLSDPMAPEHDDFRKLLTATSELHKLDFRRQVRAPWRCDATHATRRDATRSSAVIAVLCWPLPAVESAARTAAQPYVRSAVATL